MVKGKLDCARRDFFKTSGILIQRLETFVTVYLDGKHSNKSCVKLGV